MEIRLTKPIELFIEKQLARGYSDAGEVTRQALLRWMEEEEFDTPPRIQEKLEAARKGEFKPYDRNAYDSLISSLNEAHR